MSLANYADLQTSIAAWSNRSDLGPYLADFITLAEAKMSADLSAKSLEQIQVISIASGVGALPDNVISVQSLRTFDTTYPEVEITSRERVQQLIEALYSGRRSYAYFVGQSVYVYPTYTGSLEITAKCRVPPLSGTGTNWVMSNYPNVYLFGSLMEVADFMKDETALAKWTIRYAQAVEAANKAQYSGQTASAKVWGVR